MHIHVQANAPCIQNGTFKLHELHCHQLLRTFRACVRACVRAWRGVCAQTRAGPRARARAAHVHIKSLVRMMTILVRLSNDSWIASGPPFLFDQWFRQGQILTLFPTMYFDYSDDCFDDCSCSLAATASRQLYGQFSQRQFNEQSTCSRQAGSWQSTVYLSASGTPSEPTCKAMCTGVPPGYAH